ncbi:unnamed protein product [Urochloa humidicola]
MEPPPGRRETSPFSQHPNSTLADNGDGPMQMEMEIAAGEDRNGAPDAEEVRENVLLDSGKLGALKRREFFDNLLKTVEDDNLRFLQRQKERIERVGVKLAAIEVTYENLSVEAESRVGVTCQPCGTA